MSNFPIVLEEFDAPTNPPQRPAEESSNPRVIPGVNGSKEGSDTPPNDTINSLATLSCSEQNPEHDTAESLATENLSEQEQKHDTTDSLNLSEQEPEHDTTASLSTLSLSEQNKNMTLWTP